MTPFNELRKRIQITEVRLASKRAQPLLDPQICRVVLQEREISAAFHTPDYPRVPSRAEARNNSPNLVHQGINISNRYPWLLLNCVLGASTEKTRLIVDCRI
jgi:hypothetical protein